MAWGLSAPMCSSASTSTPSSKKEATSPPRHRAESAVTHFSGYINTGCPADCSRPVASSREACEDLLFSRLDAIADRGYETQRRAATPRCRRRPRTSAARSRSTTRATEGRRRAPLRRIVQHAARANDASMEWKVDVISRGRKGLRPGALERDRLRRGTIRWRHVISMGAARTPDCGWPVPRGGAGPTACW